MTASDQHVSNVVSLHGIQPLTDREFKDFQKLIYEHAGIYLRSVKKALVVGRLSKRIRDLGLDSFRSYYDLIRSNPKEMVCMLDLICTNETQFFREPKQFEYIEESVLPQWIREANDGSRPKRIRVWSAGCSTGEEPYSIAMMLMHHCPPEDGWSIEITATDLSTKVLAQARRGVWPIQRSGQIPKPLLKRFMLKGVGSSEGTMKASSPLRNVIQFSRLNLNDDKYPFHSRFDLIFCRNVLIYFDAASKSRVIERLIDRLSPGGLLFVGHSESLTGVTSRARVLVPTVYAKRESLERTA